MTIMTAVRWTATDRVEVVVPDAVSPRTATLAEPLAVAVHAVELSQKAVGDVVSVYGAGPIGVLIALVARHAGASVVVITEPSPWRREVAASLGFIVVAPDSTMAATLASLTDGEGADTTFDSAAHPSVAAEFAAITRVRAESSSSASTSSRPRSTCRQCASRSRPWWACGSTPPRTSPVRSS